MKKLVWFVGFTLFLSIVPKSFSQDACEKRLDEVLLKREAVLSERKALLEELFGILDPKIARMMQKELKGVARELEEFRKLPQAERIAKFDEVVQKHEQSPNRNAKTQIVQRNGKIVSISFIGTEAHRGHLIDYAAEMTSEGDAIPGEIAINESLTILQNPDAKIRYVLRPHSMSPLEYSLDRIVLPQLDDNSDARVKDRLAQVEKLQAKLVVSNDAMRTILGDFELCLADPSILAALENSKTSERIEKAFPKGDFPELANKIKAVKAVAPKK